MYVRASVTRAFWANTQDARVTDALTYIARDNSAAAMYPLVMQDLGNQGSVTGGAVDAAMGSNPAFSGPVRSYALAVEQIGQRWAYEGFNMSGDAAQCARIMHAVNRQWMRRTQYIGAPDEPGGVLSVPYHVMQRKYDIVFDWRPEVIDEQAAIRKHTDFMTVCAPFGPIFNAAKGIKQYAQMLHYDGGDYVMPQMDEPARENWWFENSEDGDFPHPAMTGDNHEHHLEVHSKEVQFAQARGEVSVFALQRHMAGHSALMTGGAPAGPPGPPGSGEGAGAPPAAAPEGMPPEQAQETPPPEEAAPVPAQGTPVPAEGGYPRDLNIPESPPPDMGTE